METIARKLIKNGPDKVEETPRRVRALFDGTCVVDTTMARHVWEHPYYPQYWVPFGEIEGVSLSTDHYIDAERTAALVTMKPLAGITQKLTKRVLAFHQGPLAGLVRLPFDDMGA